MSIRKILSGNIRKLIPAKSMRFYLNISAFIKSMFSLFDLNVIAKSYKTDKFGKHNYTPNYHRYFKSKRFKRVRVLEIGIGGYENPEEGGASLRMWRTYFLRGKIFAVDIYNKKPLNERRIKTFVCSQIDEAGMVKINNDFGPFDFIIDDGSHVNSHVITTFKFMFPLLKDGGVYAIEDTQTSYLSEYGGSLNSNDEECTNTFFSKFVHGTNHAEIANYSPSYYDLNIVSIEFLHNQIFIRKGNNSKPSWIVKK